MIKPQWLYGRKMPVTAHYTDAGGTEIEVPLVLLEDPPEPLKMWAVLNPKEKLAEISVAHTKELSWERFKKSTLTPECIRNIIFYRAVRVRVEVIEDE